jgi:ABC-2 type transport system ATP-binding protein
VTAQDATVDVALTGRQNLVMLGELSRLTRPDAKRRADELLERFDLVGASDRIVKGYSGGMRRRLDLAASLVTRPPILFLDEPTTGLDPTSRASMWDVIRGLLGDGVTVLLTTQYLDEADQLAHRISVIDHGRVIAEGTPAELKATTGRQRLEVRLSEPRSEAVEALAALASSPPVVGDDGRTVTLAVDDASGLASKVVEVLRAIGVVVDEVAVHRPSLDDVFFHLTGHAATEDPTDAEAA